MKVKKQNKTKIGVGSIVKAKVGDLEKIKREGRSRRMSKEVVGYAQAMAGKNKFLVKFKDGNKKEISSSLLVFLSSKEEVEMDEALYHSPKK